jgi:putrescine importer
MANPTAPPAATSSPSPTDSGLKRVLGLPSLVLFGLVYMVPLTVFTTYGIVTQVSGGRVPLAYLVTLAAMVFTARSYGLMARAFPFAGSAYTYTQRSFGPGIGFLAGWALMLDYLFLPMINYLVIGIYMGAAFPAIPSWIFILAAIALVTVLNVVGIVSVTRANFVIIALQAVFIVVFIALSIGAIAQVGTVDLLAPFSGTGDPGGFPPVLAGAAILCLSFLGFDSVSTLAEETREPKKVVPKAIMMTTISAGILFVLLSYVGHLVLPSHDFTDVDSAALDVMGVAGGQFLAAFFTAAYVAGCIGSALASQASVSRILFAMGRDKVLPSGFFGRINKRFGTPVLAILSVSVISLIALVIDLGLLAEMISFGALIAFSVVNLSVVRHYFMKEKEREGAANLINHLIVPLIGFALVIWLWTSLSSRTLIVGLIWLAVGFIYLLIITRGFRRPTPMLELKD